MRFLAELTNGYLPGTDHNDIDPKLLARYYGTEGPAQHRSHGQTGAGHYEDEEQYGNITHVSRSTSISGSNLASDNSSVHSTSDNSSSGSSSDQESSSHEGDDSMQDSDDSLNDHLAADQQHHVRHPPIPVPNSASPFEDPSIEGCFLACLEEVRQRGIVPPHYGLLESEWTEGGYDELEDVTYGRGGRARSIFLPFQIWWPRAVAWAQGLECMTEFLVF